MAVENSTRSVKRKSSDTFETIARKKSKHHAQDRKSPEKSMKDSSTFRRKASAPKPLRPKRATTFTLPNHLRPPVQTTTSTIKSKQSNRSSTFNPTAKSEPPLTRLTRINILLEALHRRNKNQHRNQPFYKHFNLLRRSVARLLNLHQTCISDDTKQLPSSSLYSSKGLSSAEKVRQRFERESRLRSQREVHEEWIRETIVPGAYVGFTELIADTQFAQLGIVLLGVLTDVTSIVGLMRKVDAHTTGKSQIRNSTGDQRRGAGTEVVGLSTLVTGPDRGEVVKRIYGNDGGGRGVVEEVALLDDDKDMINGNEHANEDLGESIDRASHERARDFVSTIAAATDGKQDSNVSASASASTPLREDDMELDGTRTSSPPPSGTHSVIAEQQPHRPPPLTSPVPSNDVHKNQKISNLPQHSPSSVDHAPNPSLRQSRSKAKFQSKYTTLSPIDQDRDPKDETNSLTTTTTTIAAAAEDRNDAIKTKKEKTKKKGKKNAIDDLFSGFE